MTKRKNTSYSSSRFRKSLQKASGKIEERLRITNQPSSTAVKKPVVTRRMVTDGKRTYSPMLPIKESVKTGTGDILTHVTYTYDPSAYNLVQEPHYELNGQKLDVDNTPYTYYDPSLKKHIFVNSSWSSPSIASEDLVKMKAVPVPNYGMDLAGFPDSKTGYVKFRGVPGSVLNLTDVPYNVLDTIAINSGRSRTNPWTNFGLTTKESTFGENSPLLHKDHSGQYYTPEELVNDHAYWLYADDYYKPFQTRKSARLEQMIGKYPSFYNNKVLPAIAEDQQYRDDITSGRTNVYTPLYSDNMFQDAFLRYQARPNHYNYNQHNYQQMVNYYADFLKKYPGMQDWWNKEGKSYYEKGLKEGLTPPRYTGELQYKGNK